MFNSRARLRIDVADGYALERSFIASGKRPDRLARTAGAGALAGNRAELLGLAIAKNVETELCAWRKRTNLQLELVGV